MADGRSWFPRREGYAKLYTEEVFEVSNSKGADPEAAKEYQRLRKGALVVSWISVVFAFVTGVTAVVLGNKFDSESLFGYGLDAILDSLSSVAVLWRFHSNGSHVSAEAKERRACIVIAIFFFVSTASLLFKSITALAKGSRNDDIDDTERIVTDVFSSICGVIEVLLGIFKVYYGKRLESQSLITDSIITYAGAAMSFLGVLSLELYVYDNRIWYLDPAFGLSCGLFLFCFGLKLIIQMTCLYQRKHHDAIMDDNNAP